MLPYRLYLSGGGICVVAHVGALMELRKHVVMSAIKEWMGVSAGALVAMCLAIGFTLEELYEIAVRFDFAEIKEMDSLPGWILHFGVDTGERLQKLVDACLHVKDLPSSFTFKECQERFGVSLRIVVTDLNDAAARMYSPTDTPDDPISLAVRASMTFPYYFQPVICPRTGHYLVDGAVMSNYPLFLLPKDEHRQTLSLLIRTEIEVVKENMEELAVDQLIARPLSIALNEKIKHEAMFYDAHCISIQLGTLNILDFGMEEATKKELVKRGQDAVAGYFKDQRQGIGRRKSIS
jgi:predicted acylesterase/phospholipase RssA